MNGMVEVLTAHLYDLRTHSCACMEKRKNPPHLGFKKHAAHQAAALSAAGFGPVREAKAEALEEAAASTPIQWDFGDGVSGVQIRPWLRSRAAELRNP